MGIVYKSLTRVSVSARSNAPAVVATIDGSLIVPDRKYVLMFQGTANAKTINSVVSYMRVYYDSPSGIEEFVNGGWEGNGSRNTPAAMNTPLGACTVFYTSPSHSAANDIIVTMWPTGTTSRSMDSNGFVLLIDITDLTEYQDYWFAGYNAATPTPSSNDYTGCLLEFTAPTTGEYVGFCGGSVNRGTSSGSSTTDLLISADVFDGIGGIKLSARHEYEDGSKESIGILAAAAANLTASTTYQVKLNIGTSDATKCEGMLNACGAIVFAPNAFFEVMGHVLYRNYGSVVTGISSSQFPNVDGEEYLVFSGYTSNTTTAYAYVKATVDMAGGQVGETSDAIGLSASNTADKFGATSAAYFLGNGFMDIRGKMTADNSGTTAPVSFNVLCLKVITEPPITYHDLSLVDYIGTVFDVTLSLVAYKDISISATISTTMSGSAESVVDTGIPITITAAITFSGSADAESWYPLIDLSNLTFEHSVGNVSPPLSDIRSKEGYAYTTHSAATLHVDIDEVTGYTPALIALERYYSNSMTIVSMQRWYELQAADVVSLYRAYGIKTTENIQTVALYREYDIEVGAAAPIELRISRHYSVFNPFFETRLLQLINEERDRVGVAGHVQKFSMYGDTENISQKHCIDMDVADEYNHDSTRFPAGYETAYKRMERLAPYYSRGAENTAIVHALPLLEDLNLLVSADYFYESWRNSSGHYGNMIYDWEGYTGVEGVEAEIQLGLHAYARDHLRDTYHGTYTDYRPYVNYLCFANHNFLLSPRDTAVSTTVKMERTYALNAPTVVRLFRGYELNAYAHVTKSIQSLYGQDVRLSFDSIYSSPVAVSLEAPYNALIGSSVEARYGATVKVATSVGSIYDIDSGNRTAVSLDAPYGLTVGKSILAEYGVAPAIRMSLEAVYGETPVTMKSISSMYGDAPAVRTDLLAAYGETPLVRAELLSMYDNSAVARLSVDSPYDDTPAIRASVVATYGTNKVVRKAIDSSYNGNQGIRLSLLSEYAGSVTVSTGIQSVYDLSMYNPVAVGVDSYYDLVSSTTTINTGKAQINFGGQTYPVDVVEIGISEGDAYWSGSITPASKDVFHKLTRGTRFTLDMFGTLYNLVVDGRTTSRSEVVNRSMSVQVSTIASLRGKRLAATVSHTNTEAIQASELAEYVLGVPIDWQMVDWTIPAYRFSIESSSPIEAAKVIVSAAGGILLSDNLGNFIAQTKHRVSVRNYDGSHDLTISDENNNLSQNESPDFIEVKNRFRISEAISTFSDRIEYTPTEIDGETMNYGELRVYPSPWRTGLQVRTTSGANVPLSYVGINTREEQQTVEFIKGDASLSYPIEAIIEVEWLSQPTGGIVFDKYATNLTTATTVNEGYGLAKIRYTTTAIVYNTSLPIDTDVQFVVEEV